MSFILSEDEALKALLQGFTVSDEKNANRAVQVWYANPDPELRAQSFPYITLELIGMDVARYRMHEGLIVDNDLQGTIAPVSGMDYVYELPVPWDLTYQVTSYSRHPRHDRAILAHLLNTVFPAHRGFLKVTNDLGTETGYRHLILEEFVKRDIIEDGRRTYRNIFTVTVTSEGQPTSYENVKEATSVEINDTTSNIPPDKQPI